MSQDDRWLLIPKGTQAFREGSEGDSEAVVIEKDLLFRVDDEERCLYTDIEDGAEWLFWQGDCGARWAVDPEDAEILTDIEVLARVGGV